MKFINIAEEQLSNGIEKAFKNHEDFFKEYFSTLEDKKQFHENIEVILRDTNIDLTKINIGLLTKRLSSLMRLLKRSVKKIVIPDVIFFVGLNNFDGHGLILNGKPYIFLNMTRMNEMLENKSFIIDLHLLHETFHAIHYYHSPSFYLRNYKSTEHHYLKRMLAEGVATYLSKDFKKASFDSALWLGLIDREHFTEWVKNCTVMKRSMWELIKNAIASNNFDVSLINTLFAVPGARQEDLVKGRFGYYYGTEIVRKVAEKEGLRILFLEYEEFRNYVEPYFKE
ncbi:hypothetical protein [Caldisericum exile]|uniref:DUF2268 domain-containing protein n=1 Tax=Caldisericum exile (strain DSM 21853 / NBRC 104410 / AZM16c01) TaxID=511051 RepID=A0A7U6GFH1_CALEA|nr:hypothetical protein [Caldisericum exile]BAL81429.1 hypothetical protein CSE_13030 [Caldisericum exile AZM16c01]